VSDPSSGARVPSADEIRLFAFQVWSYKQGELVSLLIHLGSRLGLFPALWDAGPVSPRQLADKTGLDERWVTEWLRAMGAAKLLDWHEDDRFELSAAGAAVLADEDDSLFYAAGAFGRPADATFVDDLAGAFSTGVGFPFDRQGPEGAHRTERMLGPWTRLALVPRILPALDGVVGKLEQGGRVADVGCGAGVAIVAIGRAFPKAEVHGYDISKHAVERAKELIDEGGVGDNVTVHHSGARSLPEEPTFDLVLTLDCLHDMTRPAETFAAIRRAIQPDGTWLIKDIRCAPSARDNLVNPMAAMMYGFSITSCISSALSEPDGAGLGTLGLHPELVEEMSRTAGFSRFTVHDFDEPANLYYEVRP
jgi:SAM-dependent methyltransferase